MCFQLSILTSSPFPSVNLGGATSQGSATVWYSIVYKKLFVDLLLLLIVLEIVIYMWDSLYGSNCLEVNTTETLRGFVVFKVKVKAIFGRS